MVPPRKRFKDQLKRQLTQAGIDHSEWEALAEDREEWRGTIKTVADNFEEGRKTAAAEKRQRRKDSASQPVTDTTFSCPSCSRACRSRIGLHSHQRACRRHLPLPSDLRTRRNSHQYAFGLSHNCVANTTNLYEVDQVKIA